MAELRSFIIGVTIAALVLGFAAVAFGAFDGGDDSPPSVKLLGTPPASRTAIVESTRPVVTITPSTSAAPVATNTPLATATRAPIATATATPRPAATSAPAPTATQPSGVPVSTYTTRVTDLRSQVTYLQANASSPDLNNDGWKQNSTVAAQNIQAIAAAINGGQPPACLSNAHGAVSSAASQASQAAGQMLSAIASNDANAVSQAASALNSAAQAINAGVTAINGSTC